MRHRMHLVGALGALLLLTGSAWGLLGAPSERYMGNVQRIMYVHVPTAWIALVAFTAALACAVAWLWNTRWRSDHALEATVEVGTVLGALLLVQGSIWARPTWGVWWSWDPRLTSSAVMVLMFAGILALRGFVDDPRRRADLSAVATVIAYVNIPIVYFSVRWWNSLHQLQSSPQTVDATMVAPLRINAFGMLFLACWFAWMRMRAAESRHALEMEEEP
ncbi:MAG: hypothetical protein RLZZ299_2943 [Pseudomonadota bacterium]|jgi:heme exporter protein C